MIQTHLHPERSAPLWAVLGAPLVGIPLMVMLLAVTAPKDRALEAAWDAASECVEELLLQS